MSAASQSDNDGSGSQSVAVLAPTPHDAHICQKVLRGVGIRADFCQDIRELCSCITQGANVALVAEEFLKDDDRDHFKMFLDNQPTWSDFPIVILLAVGDHSNATTEQLLSLGNVTLVKRPLRIAVFVNTLRAKLRDRARQYAVRDLLHERDRASEVAENNAQRLSLALRMGGMAAWEWTPTASIWQPELFDLLGVDGPAEASPETFFRCVHPDDLPGLQAGWRRATAGEDSFNHVFRVVRQDGSIRWLTGVGDCIRDSEHSVIRMHGLIWDVTAEKENESQLQIALANYEASNAKLRALIDTSIVFAGVLDLDGRVTEANEASTTSCGFERAEVMGQPFWDGPWWSGIPGSQRKIRKAFEKVLQGEVYRADLAYRIGDGSRRLGDFAMSPARSDDGNVLYVVANGIDNTERIEIQRALRLSEQRLRTAAEAAGFGTVHVDLNAETVTYSAEFKRLVGLCENAEPTVQAGQIPDWVHAEDRDRVKRFYDGLPLLAEGQSDTVDHRIVRADGQIRWVRLLAKPHFSGKSGARSATQLIGTLLDITEQREFEQSLREAREQAISANESKSEFLANMSHEIRTPMTAILGYTDLVAEKLQDDETRTQLLTIRRNGEFLLEIINDILDLSKIEAGKFDIGHLRFSPNQLVEDVRSMMEVRAKEKDIELEVEYRSRIPAEIQSDPKRLKQVLINLVGNAIKFTPSGGVRIQVSYANGPKARLRFDIVDSGIGMSDEQQSRLFQPFSQGDGNVNREFGGTGLGLAISKRLIELLGGEITATSQLGKGSTFSVTLDTGLSGEMTLIQPATIREQEDTSPAPDPAALDCHVLIVDDRRDIRFLSKTLLAKAGAEISEAEDGEIALAMVEQRMGQQQQFDLILLDMQMPRLDGYETAQRLRSMGYSGPIVALTADAMQGDMKRCLDSGCNDYLSKPINARKLLEMVSDFTKVDV